MELFGLELFEIAHSRSKSILSPLSDDPDDFIPHDVSNITFQQIFDTMEDATDTIRYLYIIRIFVVSTTATSASVMRWILKLL